MEKYNFKTTVTYYLDTIFLFNEIYVSILQKYNILPFNLYRFQFQTQNQYQA